MNLTQKVHLGVFRNSQNVWLAKRIVLKPPQPSQRLLVSKIPPMPTNENDENAPGSIVGQKRSSALELGPRKKACVALISVPPVSDTSPVWIDVIQTLLCTMDGILVAQCSHYATSKRS